MPKFMKNLFLKKRLVDYENIEVTHNYSSLVSNIMEVKNEDPSLFTIPYTIRVYKFGEALYDLGASITLMLNVFF